MPKARRAVPSRKRKNKILKAASGYRGRSSNCYKLALRARQKAMAYNYIHRKHKKRTFRRLWIMRINAFVRNLGFCYSDFIMKFNKSDIKIDRKMMSHLAVSSPSSFESLVGHVMKGDVEKAKQAPLSADKASS